MDSISATEVSRNFSAILSRVSAGESVEVVRNGAPVARIVPPPKPGLSPAALRALLDSAPEADEQFADDVLTARDALGPPRSPWPS